MNKKSKFPKGFFSQPRPHANKKEDKKDNIPFQWSKDVLIGKVKGKIVSLNKN